jgi:P-type E1-E2 ATPase
MYYNNQMLEIQFPGQPALKLENLVCDINGTLTTDGHLIDGVKAALDTLKPGLDIHLLSADTLGSADELAGQLGVKLAKIKPGNEASQKAQYLMTLGCEKTAAIGQGVNDTLMFKRAALGICVLSREGTAVPALMAARIVVPDILSALELLSHPMRIVATLRE